MKNIRTWLIASETLYGNVDDHYEMVGKIQEIDWALLTVLINNETYVLSKPHRLDAWDDLIEYSVKVLEEYPLFNIHQWTVIGSCLSGLSADHPKIRIGSESEGSLDSILSSKIIAFESTTNWVETDYVIYILQGASMGENGISAIIDAVDKTKNDVPPKIEMASRSQYKDYIENSFTYHSPKGDQQERYQQLRSKAKELAHMIDELVPNSMPFNYKHDAFHNLEMAIMFANKGIACGE